MAKTRAEKEKIVKDIIEKLSKAKSLVFTNFQGLPVAEIEEIRKELKNNSCEYQVVKNTLFKIALKNAGYKDNFEEISSGPLAVTFGYKDEISPFKLISKLSANYEALEIRGGIYEKKFIPKEMVEQLAKVPTREESLIKLIGVLNSLPSGLVYILEGNLRKLILILKNISEKE